MSFEEKAKEIAWKITGQFADNLTPTGLALEASIVKALREVRLSTIDECAKVAENLAAEFPRESKYKSVPGFYDGARSGCNEASKRVLKLKEGE